MADLGLIGALLLIGDISAVGLALALGTEVARLVYGGLPEPLVHTGFSEADRAGRVLALRVLPFTWLWAKGHYSRRLSLLTGFSSVVAGTVILCLADAYLRVVAISNSPSRLWIIAIWGLAAVLILVGRIALKHALFRLEPWRCPTLVAGTRNCIEDLQDLLRSDPHSGYVPEQVIDTESGDPRSELRLRLVSGRMRYVVFAFDVADKRTTLDLARIVDEEFRLPIGLVLGLEGVSLGDLEIRQIVGANLLILDDHRNSKSPIRLVCKRTLDITTASMLLPRSSPGSPRDRCIGEA